MLEKFNIGDKVEFIKGFREGEKGILIRSFFIAGIPWYSIKINNGYIISGQFDGDFKKIKDKD